MAFKAVLTDPTVIFNISHHASACLLVWPAGDWITLENTENHASNVDYHLMFST